MIKKMIYIGMYDVPNSKAKRFYSLAAINKMNYIINLLNENKVDVSIYSNSKVKEDKFKYYPEEKVSISSHNTVYITPSIGCRNKLLKGVRIIINWIWLISKILRNTKKNDTIIIYHTLEAIIPLLIIKKIHKIKYILEVEEIYSQMPHISPKYKRLEQKLLQEADYYITVSDTLRKLLPSKPGISIYGNYQQIEINKISKVNDSIIKLVFTGSIDKIRGAFTAVKSMQYLPQHYKLYISGVGNSNTIDELKKEIENINKLKNCKVCEYLGMLDEYEYDKLLKNTDIALNPQINGDYSKYLFPSKIIQYLNYNLPTVTTKGESIIESPFANILYFSEDFTPESFAKAIQEVHLDNTDYKQYLNRLHKELLNKIKTLISY